MSAQFQNVKILIIDHNPGMSKIMATVLRALGFPALQMAEDGAEALRNISNYGPDLIISELKMPVMDGITFVRTLRADLDNPSSTVPIIVASGHTEDRHVRACLAAGADQFLAKPISGQSLAERIGRIVRDDRDYVQTPDYSGPKRNLAVVEMMKAS